MIVTYDRQNIFIVQATDGQKMPQGMYNML